MHKQNYSILGDVARWHSCLDRTRRLWLLIRDDRSGVLIGAVEMRRSDWQAVDVRARRDRQTACKERSIARVHGQAAAVTKL